MATPDLFEFANEFGHRRESGTFRHLAAAHIHDESQKGARVGRYVFADSVTQRDVGYTYVCVDEDSMILKNIAAGSFIEHVDVSISSDVDPNLSLAIGFLGDPSKVTSRELLEESAKRVRPSTNPIGGNVLNKFRTIRLNGSLTGAHQKILGLMDAFNSESGHIVDSTLNNALDGTVTLGELFDVSPCVTVLKGKLTPGQLKITVHYKAC